MIQNIFPDPRLDTSIAQTSYVSMTDDGSSWWLKISNLGPYALGSVITSYKFTLIIQAPPFQHSFDGANIECSFRDSADAVVYSATGSEVVIDPNYTDVVLPTTGNTLTVSTD